MSDWNKTIHSQSKEMGSCTANDAEPFSNNKKEKASNYYISVLTDISTRQRFCHFMGWPCESSSKAMPWPFILTSYIAISHIRWLKISLN